MSELEKRTVADYASLLKGLSKEVKQELIHVLSQSLESNESAKETDNPTRFAFIAEKSVEEIIDDLRNSRHFREKDLSF